MHSDRYPVWSIRYVKNESDFESFINVKPDTTMVVRETRMAHMVVSLRKRRPNEKQTHHSPVSVCQLEPNRFRCIDKDKRHRRGWRLDEFTMTQNSDEERWKIDCRICRCRKSANLKMKLFAAIILHATQCNRQKKNIQNSVRGLFSFFLIFVV